MGRACRSARPHQPGVSCPNSSKWSLLFPAVPPRTSGGRVAWPGMQGCMEARMKGCGNARGQRCKVAGMRGHRDSGLQPSPACSLLRGRRGAGGGRAVPVAWQLPCKSPSCQKPFFPAIQMDFTGAGSGLADQVVLRNHTLYLEGLHIHFGQVLALQPSTDCKTQLLTGTAQWGGLQRG